MSFLKRMLRPGSKREHPAAAQMLAFFGLGQAIHTNKDYASLTEAGYKGVAAVYGCISLITKGAAGINWVVKRRTGKGKWAKEEDHVLAMLLMRPNKRMGRRRFVANALGYKLLSGNSYIHKSVALSSLRPGDPANKVELWPLRPDKMEILAGTAANMIGGYQYNAAVPRKFSPEEILHIAEFHPLDDFYGLSRLEVAARDIDISNWSGEWNLKSLQKDMRPPGAVKIKEFITEKQREDFKRDLKRYQGALEDGEIPLFYGGADWINLSLSPKDIQWLEGGKATLRRLCSIYHVWSGLMGDTESSTYANYQEGRKGLYLEAILPEMDDLRDEFNNWLAPDYGDDILLDYDRDNIEAIQEDRAKRYSYLTAADWVRVNEKREATGFESLGPEGDVVLVPIGKIPLQAVIDSGGGSGTAAMDEGNEARRLLTAGQRLKALPMLPAARSFWTSVPERKRALWNAFAIRVKTREKSFVPIAARYLKRQKDEILAAVSKAVSVNSLAAEQLIDKDAEAQRYVKSFAPWYRDHFLRAGNAGVKAGKGELAVEDAEDELMRVGAPDARAFKLTPAREEQLMQMVFNSGTKVNESTIDKIYEILRTAQDDNWTVNELARFIKDKVVQFDYWRAENWARTESAKIENWGQLEGYRETEFVTRKGWLCSFVPTSREAHMAADGQEVGLDEDFMVGGENLAYPGDPRGKPGNVCECLCTVYPVVG